MRRMSLNRGEKMNNKNNTWMFEAFKITRSSLIIIQCNAANPNKQREQVTHIKHLSEEKFNQRLTHIISMIKTFRKNALKERLVRLREQEQRLTKRWNRDVLFAGPAAPNKKLNRCSQEIRQLEKELGV